MDTIVISEAALRQFINELYDELPVETSPITVNQVVDPQEPDVVIDPNFKPQSKVELLAALKNLIAKVSTDDISRTYDAIKLTVDNINKEEENTDMKTLKDKHSQQKQLESIIRSEIRKMLAEAGSLPQRMDPADIEADEDEREEVAARKFNTVSDVSGAKLKEISQEFGLSIAGARRLVDETMKKVKFLQTQMEDDDRDLLVLSAVKDYIEMLESSGELTPEDVTLLVNNPSIISSLDGFREFFHKYVKRAMRKAGKDESEE